MHSPSMLSPHLAHAVVADHARAASARRASREGHRPVRRLRRRGGVARGRVTSPLAH